MVHRRYDSSGYALKRPAPLTANLQPLYYPSTARHFILCPVRSQSLAAILIEYLGDGSCLFEHDNEQFVSLFNIPVLNTTLLSTPIKGPQSLPT